MKNLTLVFVNPISFPNLGKLINGILNFLLFIFLLKYGIIAEAQVTDRSKLPELGPPPSLKLPPIQNFTLSNGLKVIALEKHEVPLIQLELIVNAGSVLDPPKLNGLAQLTAAMLDKGAGKRDVLELSDEIDFLGASITTFAGYHTAGIVLHTPVSKFDSSLALFVDIVLSPRFPEMELDRLRKEQLTKLLQQHDQPWMIVSVLLNRVLYGSEHPYGIPIIGDEKSLKMIKVDDLKKFHKSYYTPDNSTLIMVGDFDVKKMVKRIDQVFRKWKRNKPVSIKLPNINQVVGRKIYLVDKPAVVQSEIRIARIGVRRLTEDYFPIIVMNTILGGSFTSRLNQNLREKHGFTYGANSYFDFRPAPGPFVAGAAVQTDVTDKAILEFIKEFQEIMHPVSEDELVRAKNYLALQYPANFKSVSGIARQLADIAVYNLPNDYFNQYINRVLDVTVEDVQRVAKKLLDPNNIAIVIVGDREQIEQKIVDSNLGQIEFLTIEEVLGKPPVIEDD